MENTFENALKYVQHLDQDNESWYNNAKTIASAMMSYAAKTSQKSDCISHVSECVLYSDGTNMQYKGDADLTLVLDGQFKGISLKQLGKGKITIDTPSDR